MALVAVTIGIDHGDLDAIDKANCVGAFLTIVETAVDLFYRRSVKNSGRVLKGDPMAADICGVFRRIRTTSQVFTERIYKCRDVRPCGVVDCQGIALFKTARSTCLTPGGGVMLGNEGSRVAARRYRHPPRKRGPGDGSNPCGPGFPLSAGMTGELTIGASTLSPVPSR